MGPKGSRGVLGFLGLRGPKGEVGDPGIKGAQGVNVSVSASVFSSQVGRISKETFLTML